MNTLGRPHLHYATLGSTNDRARELARDGAPGGTIVTAAEQTAGRGRRGRSWQAPPDQALLISALLRDPPELLTLRVAIAVATACGAEARIKWPNDVLIDGLKVAGILCEQQLGADWAIAGIGVNVAVDLGALEPEVRESAGTLGREKADIGPFREELLVQLASALELSNEDSIQQWSARDALLGHEIEWNDGAGTAVGIDADGRLLVDVHAEQIALDSGEVSLVRAV